MKNKQVTYLKPPEQRLNLFVTTRKNNHKPIKNERNKKLPQNADKINNWLNTKRIINVSFNSVGINTKNTHKTTLLNSEDFKVPP